MSCLFLVHFVFVCWNGIWKAFQANLFVWWLFGKSGRTAARRYVDNQTTLIMVQAAYALFI